MKTKCLICAKEFRTYPSEIKKGWGKYCSQKCSGVYRKSIGYKPPPRWGAIPWNKGLKGLRRGEENNRWVGEFPSYLTLHKRINAKLGKAVQCSFDSSHKSTRYQWANVSGSYLEDVGDWTQLCPTCHMQYDKLLHHPKSNIYNDDGTDKRKVVN